MIQDLVTLFFTIILIDNLVFFRVMGVKTFLDSGISFRQRFDILCIILFSVLISVFLNNLIFRFVLQPFNLSSIRTFVFVIVIVAVNYLVRFLVSRKKYDCLESSIPFISNNCLVLAVCFIVSKNGFTLFESLRYAAGISIGFFAAILVFSSLLERMELSELPDFMRGMPSVFIAAGLVAISLWGFTALKF